MVDMNPTVASTWRSLGLAHYAAANYGEAHKAFKAAVNLDSQDADSTFGLANVAAALGNHDEAITAYDDTLNLRPNHSAARQALIAALVYRGKEHMAAGNTVRGEADVERAYKMDRRNPELVKYLAKHFIDTGQKGKVAKLAEYAAQDLPGDEVTTKLQEFIATNPDYASYKVQQVAHGTTVQQPQRPQAQQVPCPNCKAMVMEWAAVCPSCNYQIKAVVSQFTGRGPAHTTQWQEVAYYILAGLWCVLGAVTILGGVGKPFGEVLIAFGSLDIIIGLGLFTHNDIVQNIAKIIAYLNILFGGLGLIMGIGLGSIVSILESLFTLGLAGFQIYILNFNSEV
jgi:tetratricopeptide (TPR) repeat protein